MSWPSPRTASAWPRPARTRRCACGTWTARRRARSCAARAAARAWPSRPTALGWPAPNHTRGTVLETETAKVLADFSPNKVNVLAISPLSDAFSPDGKLAVTGGGGDSSHYAFVWKTEDGTLLRRLTANSWLAGTSA